MSGVHAARLLGKWGVRKHVSTCEELRMIVPSSGIQIPLRANMGVPSLSAAHFPPSTVPAVELLLIL